MQAANPSRSSVHTLNNPAMPTQSTYSIMRLDRTAADLPSMAEKYRGLRLFAIETNPENFASTFELEASRSTEDWVERLCRTGVDHFVAIAHGPDRIDEFVGQVVVFGPMALDAYALPPEASEPVNQRVNKQSETRWQLTALYTAPRHRGKGLAKMLCSAAFNHAMNYELDKKARMRLFLRPDNIAALKLYEDLGYVNGGRVTLAEAMVLNGDKDLLPEDHSDASYHDRYGLVMVKV